MPRVILLGLALALSTSAAAAQEDGADQERWWAYRPLQRPDVPAVQQTDWVRSPIDAFVLAGLEENGLRPAAPADRHALLRRITYDLTGLPPTEKEIEAFVADASPDAFEKVVDRLLDSPQYGVKWAQHWLDLVRYAETEGYERDNKKPYIWRYRDWVVDALNADMPYGEFVTRQLAGDELPDATVADHIATGYYRLGIWDDEPTDRKQHRYDDLDGIADTTARGMLAVSMGCARCHDHKKDPLPQAEYYGFLGYFENIASYDMKARRLPLDGAEQRHAQQLAQYERQKGELRGLLRDLVGEQIVPVHEEKTVVAAYGGDRGSATELIDTLGKHHGRSVGQIVQIDGQHGKALRFDGDDHAVLPRVVEESFSVTFFVRSKHKGKGRVEDTRWFTGTGLVDGEVPGVVDDWGISWHSEGVISAGSGRPETFVASAPGYNDGEWHHVAFTREHRTGRISLYVDGQLVDSANGSKRALTSPPDIYIGRMRPGGPGFRGDLDDIAFHDRALTAAEVVALSMRAGLAAAERIKNSKHLSQLVRLKAPTLPTVHVLAVNERDNVGPEAFVRMRGNVHAKGKKVELGVPAMIGDGDVATPAPTRHSTGRRLALARWIARPDNRMTWRVIANRLWQHHFGRGIVRTSNDFGVLGEKPTHPRLLDWLACEMVEQKQSLKAMHRQIVLSSTYRMSSQGDPKALREDPRNDAFWRFNRRRLTAEEVRDSILSMTGMLRLEQGGPSIYPPIPRAVLETASRPDSAWGNSSPAQANRRSLYVHVKRSLPEPLLAAFDRADTDASCPVRFATVQPTQALTMINGDFAQRMAQLFAERLLRQAKGLPAQIEAGLALISQRPPRDADAQRLVKLANELQRDFGRSPQEALQRCCLIMLNCNEFLFLD